MPVLVKKPYPVTVRFARRPYALLLLVAEKKGQTIAELVRRFTTDGIEKGGKWLFGPKRPLAKLSEDEIDGIIETYSRSKKQT